MLFRWSTCAVALPAGLLSSETSSKARKHGARTRLGEGARSSLAQSANYVIDTKRRISLGLVWPSGALWRQLADVETFWSSLKGKRPARESERGRHKSVLQLNISNLRHHPSCPLLLLAWCSWNESPEGSFQNFVQAKGITVHSEFWRRRGVLCVECLKCLSTLQLKWGPSFFLKILFWNSVDFPLIFGSFLPFKSNRRRWNNYPHNFFGRGLIEVLKSV